MEQFKRFHNFLRDRNFTLSDIDEFSDLIEPTSIDGRKGYKLRAFDSGDKLTQRCKLLAVYTWHCRDYVKHILEWRYPNCTTEQVGQIVNASINGSKAVECVSYLANEYKHDGADPERYKWAGAEEPRLGKPFVIGMQLTFPGTLKPFLKIVGDSWSEIEFAGHAETDDVRREFDDFTWRHSCEIENNKGEVIGDVVSFCEVTFALWMKLLHDADFAIFPYFMPLLDDSTTPFVRIDGVPHLLLFSDEQSVLAYNKSLPDPITEPIRCRRFRDHVSFTKFLTENKARFAEQGCEQIALDVEVGKPPKKTGVISKMLAQIKSPA